MINLNQSIAKVKKDIEIAAGMDRAGLIEAIMHEGAGKDRKTLLAWLNEQIELLPAEIDPVPVEEGEEGSTTVRLETIIKGKVWSDGVTPSAKLNITRDGASRTDTLAENVGSTPVYRPEKRGGVWCLYDVNNGEMRRETFDNKGEARVFAGRLEAGEELDEPYFHVSRG